MPGKYAGVISKLPKYEDPNQSYNDKINQRKTEILNNKDFEGLSPEQMLDERIFADAEVYVRDGLKHLMKAANMLNLGLRGRRNPQIISKYYREFRLMKDAMAAQESDVNLSIAAFESLLAEVFEVEDLSSMRLTDGGSVGVQWEPYSQIVDRDANREWAMKNGLERSLALPWQTVNAVAKQAALDGRQPPDGVKLTAKPKVVFRKG